MHSLYLHLIHSIVNAWSSVKVIVQLNSVSEKWTAPCCDQQLCVCMCVWGGAEATALLAIVITQPQGSLTEHRVGLIITSQLIGKKGWVVSASPEPVAISIYYSSNKVRFDRQYLRNKQKQKKEEGKDPLIKICNVWLG